MRSAFVAGDAVYVPAVSMVEIAYLTEKWRLPEGLFDRIAQALRQGNHGLIAVAFTVEMADTMRRIPARIVPDMPDRMIAATALYLNMPLVTRDPKIRAADLATIWWRWQTGGMLTGRDAGRALTIRGKNRARLWSMIMTFEEVLDQAMAMLQDHALLRAAAAGRGSVLGALPSPRACSGRWRGREDTPGVFSGLRYGGADAKMPFVSPIRRAHP